MNVWIYTLSGVGLAAVILVGHAAREARRARSRKAVGRHAMTAEIATVVHEAGKGYANYTTAEQARVEDAVKTTLLPPVPKFAPRTNTVMMETVNPADYPEWINNE